MGSYKKNNCSDNSSYPIIEPGPFYHNVAFVKVDTSLSSKAPLLAAINISGKVLYLLKEKPTWNKEHQYCKLHTIRDTYVYINTKGESITREFTNDVELDWLNK
ncbi:MAG: hypothetical protein GY810_19120 [Aureispira sp.]|nr:hypothetical protein [Aureispira sp.]